MKKLIAWFLLLTLLFLTPCYGKSTTSVGKIEGTILHSIQSPWVIVESENSADTQTDALTGTTAEVTKLGLDIVIAANAAQEEYISTFNIPSKWNSLRFRAIGITDGHTLTHQIYLGTLGGEPDCSLVYAGQLLWTIGPHKSIYDQITFTSGGTVEPQPGDIVTGNTSGKTAVIVSITLATNTWAGADATGTVSYRSASGTFGSGGETVTLTRNAVLVSADAYTHAATVLVGFEYADTVTATTKAWGYSGATSSSWRTISPADNATLAETEIDAKGADYMVIVTTACESDGKLLIRGY